MRSIDNWDKYYHPITISHLSGLIAALAYWLEKENLAEIMIYPINTTE